MNETVYHLMQHGHIGDYDLQYDRGAGQRLGNEYGQRGMGAGDPDQDGFPVKEVPYETADRTDGRSSHHACFSPSIHIGSGVSFSLLASK